MRYRLAQVADLPAIDALLRRWPNEQRSELQQRIAVFLSDGPHAGGDGWYPTLLVEDDSGVAGMATVGRMTGTVSTWTVYALEADPRIAPADVTRAMAEFARAGGGERLVALPEAVADAAAFDLLRADPTWRTEAVIADYYADGVDAAFVVRALQ